MWERWDRVGTLDDPVANAALDEDAPRSRRGFDVLEADLPVLSDAITLSHMNAQTQEALPR